MKKYLMRGGLNPLEIKSTKEIIANNLIGANSGNLLYAFGVYRTLMTEDVVIDMDYYGVERSYTDKDIERINKEYDAYICPLADAFRDAFTKKLYKYANFFNKLRIPYYVIGLGMRSDKSGELEESYVYDDAAKAFMQAATRNGNIVGLRGATTGKYLTRLGFEENKHFMVIGCPSMYTCGRELPIREIKLDQNGTLSPDTRIAFNMSAITPDSVMEFLFSQIERFKNHYVVEQNEAELRMLYYGLDYHSKKVSKDTMLPTKATHPILKENRYRVFANVATWRNFMHGMDLSIGSKLHGNVAAIISGCPAVFIPLDGRMKELIEYHKFPAFDIEKLTPDDTIETLLQQVDMESYLKVHPANFDRFIDFLDLNHIDHIYKTDRDRKVAPVDLEMAKKNYPEVESILFCSRSEVVKRFNEYADWQKKEKESLKKKTGVLDKEVNKLKTTIQEGIASKPETLKWYHKLIRYVKGN